MKIIPIHVHRFTSMSRTSSSQQLTIIQYENDKKKRAITKQENLEQDSNIQFTVPLFLVAASILR